ncbi:glycosyltransferase family 2 protein [Aequorivita lipolytica]|uniref:Glycosyltransferase family 2 protein n=1 Tax=Aequorivita lipolytica TaxID=153267 RepID=A0A5C6YPJ9_9FLAO|nr:glycosyltransferase [Aequorivita lipolytica]TXD68796.1 glycosyltransferase family 2 protein [Aequorivita lipolytica]SRX52046.1 Putative glycosyltransferase EpsH [Aequorivita lipolytica]
MFISVIIPTRNRYEYITLLVDDLQNQTVSNFEIIVIDQSDNKQFIADCKHIFTNTRGPCISRNVGVKKSKGDILVFLDDDARVYNDFIEEVTSPIIKDRFDAVAGAICDPEGNYLMTDDDFLKKNNSNFIKTITSNPNSEKSRITLSFPAGCSAIKTSVFHKIGGFDQSFDPTGAGEDREIAINLFKNGYATWYNSKAKLLHIAASEGGSRDLGSRSLMLDVHSYKICKKHFSLELASSLKKSILLKYQRNFIETFYTGKLIRTKYLLYIKVKRLLSDLEDFKNQDNKVDTH